jgi:hypothetical protein
MVTPRVRVNKRLNMNINRVWLHIFCTTLVLGVVVATFLLLVVGYISRTLLPTWQRVRKFHQPPDDFRMTW